MPKTNTTTPNAVSGAVMTIIELMESMDVDSRARVMRTIAAYYGFEISGGDTY